MAKRKVIRPIPSGSTRQEKAEASHLRASNWPCDEAPGGKLFAGRVYELDSETAAYLVARKGFKYVDGNGRPSNEKPPAIEAELRPGQEGWLAAELERRLEEAKAEEADPAPAPTITTIEPTPQAPTEKK